MKSLFIIIPILNILFACGSVSHPEDAVDHLQIPPGMTEPQVDSIANTLSLFPDQTQFSIALVENSTVLYYGAIRVNDTLRTIENSNDVFEIGSLSKVFTSALLADMTQYQKVELDHPINNYLDIPLHDNIRVTFRQLANHTSGLPRIPKGFVWESLRHLDNPYKDYDEKRLQKYLTGEMELQTEPGKGFQYSNIGAGILGYVLTQVEQESYEDMLQQKVFGPLAMKNSTTRREDVSDKLVAGLNKRGKPTSYWDFGALAGAGAILSTTEDLVKFAQANFDPENKVLALQRQETFTINDSRAMALGWFILKRDSGDEWYWHNGGTGGFRSSMVLDIKHNKAVIILSNISSGHFQAASIDGLSYYLLDEL